MEELKESYPELKEYGWPDGSSKSEKRSLFLQAAKHKPSEAPPHLWSEIVNAVESNYPSLNPRFAKNLEEILSEPEPTDWAEYGIRLGLSRIMLTDVKRDASPGVPLCALGATNQEVLEKSFQHVLEAAAKRFWHLSRLRGARALSPKELLDGGYTDAIRIFVKDEPHSTTKLEEGRVRLICSVSLIDQLIERLLCGEQNRKEIDLWRYIPSSAGLGLHDEGLVHIWEKVNRESQGGSVASSDMSGFDWSVQEWELYLDCEVRARLMSAGPLVSRALFNRVTCLSRAILQTTDGSMYAQLLPGVQKSGSYNTSSTNSRIRYALARMVGAPWAVTMGDDCVEAPVDGAKAKYAELGHTLKSYELLDGGFEFCSTQFSEDSAIPIKPFKMIFAFGSEEGQPIQRLAQLQYELRYWDGLETFNQRIATSQEWARISSIGNAEQAKAKEESDLAGAKAQTLSPAGQAGEAQ